MSRKAPPSKKRHTKPCKFFQVERCPHPAEVCDFAHVIASPPDRGSSIYRYYPAGYYAQDTPCRYSYGPKVPFLKPLDIPTSADSVLRVDTKNLEKVDGPPIRSWPSSAFSQKTATKSPSYTPPTPSPESVSASMSTLDLDEVVIVTEDPQYHEHPHSYQSQVYVEDNSPMIHVPPFSPLYQLTFNGPPTPPYYISGKSVDHFKPCGGTRSSTKQKNLKYKTKPCRFFLTERGCPKGSSCTFIHDDQVLSPVTDSNQENSRKNYFPVPWRVIGGGVRVGIKTEDSGPSTTDSRPLDPDFKPDKGSPSAHVISRKRSNSNPTTLNPHSQQFKVENLFSAECPGVL